MITIDGSYGEGGGQVVRTSLALSLVTGQAVRIRKVRAGRRKPGLLRQHLTALRAAADVGAARIEGDAVGSGEVVFQPNGVKAGQYHFVIGTAGSAPLVLQTVLPALITADGPSEIVLEGGTHNPFAPTFDFLAKCFLPLVERMGPRVSAALERPGYYPAGGGRFVVSITPSERLKPFDLLEAGDVRRHAVVATVARLPAHIGRRELAAVRKHLSWGEEDMQVEEIGDSLCPGNVVRAEIESDGVTAVLSEIGEPGVRAAAVGHALAKSVQEYLAAGVPVDRYLADQLLIPMALAGGGRYRMLPPTPHTTTNMHVVAQFLDVRIHCERIDDGGRAFEMVVEEGVKR